MLIHTSRSTQQKVTRTWLLINLNFLTLISVISQTTAVLTPSKDNSIYSESTNSNALGNLYAGKTGTNTSGVIRRALFRFDLSSIPSGATITSASLVLTKNKGGVATSTPSTLHKISSDWGEGTSFDDPGAGMGAGGGAGAMPTTNDATWSHRFFNTTFWTSMGSDFVSIASASTVVTATNTNYTWSSTGAIADVQNWVNNPATNFGWILRGDEVTSSSAARYNSKESVSGKPTLTVQYTTCPPSLTLTGPIPSGTYEAQVISASGSIASTAIVFFKAANSVDLQMDFSVAVGGQLQISLDGCN